MVIAIFVLIVSSCVVRVIVVLGRALVAVRMAQLAKGSEKRSALRTTAFLGAKK
jgi:hypothetical protein